MTPNLTAPTTTETQRARLLQALKAGAINTVTARTTLGIMHPAGRILDLIKRGYNISTRKINITTQQGFYHKGIAEYTLHPPEANT